MKSLSDRDGNGGELASWCPAFSVFIRRAPPAPRFYERLRARSEKGNGAGQGQLFEVEEYGSWGCGVSNKGSKLSPTHAQSRGTLAQYEPPSKRWKPSCPQKGRTLDPPCSKLEPIGHTLRKSTQVCPELKPCHAHVCPSHVQHGATWGGLLGANWSQVGPSCPS